MKKLFFKELNEKDLFKFLLENKKRKVLNFFNQHDVYQFYNLKDFSNSIRGSENINLIDGFLISAYFSIMNLRRVKRMRGIEFTNDFLSDSILSGNKKHFFIGLSDEDEVKLKKILPHLKFLKSYNPPYVKSSTFSIEEIKKMSKLIREFSPDFVWVGVGCPKQNILSHALFRKTKVKYFFNVGAGLDFLLGKKKKAPKFWSSVGLEWFYRLITDFKYSKKKVLRHFIGLRYLKNVKLSKS